jgi:hypothetical protein
MKEGVREMSTSNHGCVVRATHVGLHTPPQILGNGKR